MSRATLLRQQLAEGLRLDITALKPGNVSIHYRRAHGMSSRDFLLSGALSIPLLCDSTQACGARILAAAKATRQATGCNTNLGMLLLLTPLICAAERSPRLHTDAMRQTLGEVLASLNEQDTRDIFAAIRLMAPGGLGRAPQHDVHKPVDCNILQAMQAASDRDRIARQYVTRFTDVFQQGLPVTRYFLRRGQNWEWATTGTYLGFLASFEDSHICRKYGQNQALRVQRQGRMLARRFRATPEPVAMYRLLWQRGRQWLRTGLNPGTSADLTVASIFLCRLTEAGHRRGA